MTKRRTKEERQAPLFWGLTPNQLVGYNLWCARQERGWTQAQAAEALEPHLGVRWTVAQVSAAERSVDGTRVRQFTADDLVAFAQAFDVPITYFFIPPRPERDVEQGQTRDVGGRAEPHDGGDDRPHPRRSTDGAPLMAKHLHEVMRDLDPALFSDAQERIFALARLRLLGVVGHAVGSIGGWQQSLRALADELGALEDDVAVMLAHSLPDVTEKDFTGLVAEDAKA